MRVVCAYVTAVFALPFLVVGFIGGFTVMSVMAGVSCATDFVDYVKRGVNV